jgi:hypothetical protein
VVRCAEQRFAILSCWCHHGFFSPHVANSGFQSAEASLTGRPARTHRVFARLGLLGTKWRGDGPGVDRPSTQGCRRTPRQHQCSFVANSPQNLDDDDPSRDVPSARTKRRDQNPSGPAHNCWDLMATVIAAGHRLGGRARKTPGVIMWPASDRNLLSEASRSYSRVSSARISRSFSSAWPSSSDRR